MIENAPAKAVPVMLLLFVKLVMARVKLVASKPLIPPLAVAMIQS